MSAAGVLALLLHAALMAGAGLLLAGVLPWLRARMAGYAGPPFLLPGHDWRRLLRKRPVLAEGASALAAWAPGIALLATAGAALLTPGFTLGMATGPLGDLLLIAGLLGLARAVTMLAAIDAGAASTGLAAIRGARLGAWAEPALLLAWFTVALLIGTTNLDAALTTLRETAAPGLPLLLAVGALACVAIAIEAEDGAVIAEYAGWHAAAAEIELALRRVVWLSLVAALLPPTAPGSWMVGLGVWCAKLVVLGGLCAVVGPILARAGQVALAPLLGAAALLGLLAALFLFAAHGLA